MQQQDVELVSPRFVWVWLIYSIRPIDAVRCQLVPAVKAAVKGLGCKELQYQSAVVDGQ